MDKPSVVFKVHASKSDYSDPFDAFLDLVSKARSEHGNLGGTGTIAEKGSYYPLGAKEEGFSSSEFDCDSAADAERLSDKELNEYGGYSVWGPAGMINYKYGWLFFGKALSNKN